MRKRSFNESVENLFLERNYCEFNLSQYTNIWFLKKLKPAINRSPSQQRANKSYIPLYHSPAASTSL